MQNIHLFAQIASLIPRNVANSVFAKHKSDKGAIRLNSWTHLIAMLFCQLGDCFSLRDITFGMRGAHRGLCHLGVKHPPSRNALSYQNMNRDWTVWKDLYLKLFPVLGQQLKRRANFEGIGKHRVLIIDSTLVTLCMKLYDWARYNEEKGAVKIHTVIGFADLLPRYAYISDGKTADNTGAYHVFPKKGDVIVADRGYDDSALLHDWDSNSVAFVVRLRSDVGFRSLGEFEQPDGREQTILIDEAIEFTGDEPSKNYPHPIRRIAVYDPDKMKEPIELLTNNAKWPAQTVADLYKARWDIETFFKMLKQNLKVTSFVGTSANAVMTQIWIAMIAVLLLRVLYERSRYDWSMANLVSFIRLNLFSLVDLWKWLDNPLDSHPPSAEALTQGALF